MLWIKGKVMLPLREEFDVNYYANNVTEYGLQLTIFDLMQDCAVHLKKTRAEVRRNKVHMNYIA